MIAQAALNQQIEILEREQTELRARITELSQDKQNALKSQRDIQELYKISIEKCHQYENQVSN